MMVLQNLLKVNRYGKISTYLNSLTNFNQLRILYLSSNMSISTDFAMAPRINTLLMQRS
jgi:hypothetical protein